MRPRLLGHQISDGDLAEVVGRALDALVRELRRKKYAETEAPRKPRLVKEEDHTRHIPNHVKRAVAGRDDHQCTFVAENGQRCPARGKLEFHHIDPQAKGGAGTADAPAPQRGGPARRGERAQALPPLRRALRDGRVGYEKARLVAAHADDTSVEDFIGRAQGLTCIELKRELEAERTRADAHLSSATRAPRSALAAARPRGA